MNSMPMLSHHLFVAAVGREGRPQERSRKRAGASDAANRAQSPVDIANDYHRPLGDVARVMPAKVTQRRD